MYKTRRSISRKFNLTNFQNDILFYRKFHHIFIGHTRGATQAHFESIYLLILAPSLLINRTIVNIIINKSTIHSIELVSEK